MIEKRNGRRGNGEGSISLRKDGRGEVGVTDPLTGKRRRTYAKSEPEAKRILRRMNSRADEGHTVLDAGATVRAYSVDWFANRAGRRRRDSTVREYEYRFERWILPTLGSMKLKEVTVVDVEDLLDYLIAKGLRRETVRAVRNALAAMMQDAVRSRHLAFNFARLAQLPEGQSDEVTHIEIPTDEQVHALVKVSQGTELEAIVSVCVESGARIGEVLAMKWSDIRLDEGIWRVSRTITRGRAGETLIGARTKTGRNREVSLASQVCDALKRQRRRVAEMQVRSLHWDDNDLVFPTTIGTAQDPHNVRRALKPLANEVGFPGSFHALRHWFASIAVTVAPDVAVAKVLGHARVSTTTDLYAHLRASDATRIAVAVNVAVNKEKG